MQHACGVAVTGVAVVTLRMAGRPRVLAAGGVAREAVRLALLQGVIGVVRQARRLPARRPQAEADPGGSDECDGWPEPAPRRAGTRWHAHRVTITQIGVAPSLTPVPSRAWSVLALRVMTRGFVRDTVLYLIAALVLGTAANLLPNRHLAWWGKGQEPPKEGVDFELLDPVQADALRASLPDVVFLDTRSAAEAATGKVPGASLLSYTDLRHQLTADLLSKLGKADAVVVYGSSDETDVEQLLAQELRRHGLAPPYVMAGGFSAWAASGLEVERKAS